MPDLGALLAVAALGGLAAILIAAPLWRRDGSPSPSHAAAERAAAELHHAMALAALRDVEADRRAGSLDDAGYAVQHAEAEARAAETAAELDAADTPAAGTQAGPSGPAPDPRGARRIALWVGGLLAVALLVGVLLPPPIGLGERTVVDEALAAAIQAEEARQAEIARLLGLLSADPRDLALLSDLADAYLAGSGAQDLQRGAVALLAVLGIDPEDVSAYQRLVSAYIRAADWTDARAALDAYAEIAPDDDAELAFLEGLVAWRGEGDAASAVAAFDRFLALAPDDPRAGMVRGLRAEAAAQGE